MNGCHNLTPCGKRLLFGGVLLLLLAPACAPTPAGTDRAARGDSSFVGKVWASTDAAQAPGTMRIFLADGTLVMDSCGETYRLARWTFIDANRIAWDEDGARVEAEIGQVDPEELLIRLHLVNEVKEERYHPAAVPYVCAEVRSSQGAAGH